MTGLGFPLYKTSVDDYTRLIQRLRNFINEGFKKKDIVKALQQTFNSYHIEKWKQQMAKYDSDFVRKNKKYISDSKTFPFKKTPFGKLYDNLIDGKKHDLETEEAKHIYENIDNFLKS